MRSRFSLAIGTGDVAELDIDALQLRVVLDRGDAVLAADAGLLAAAERCLDRCDVVVVDPAYSRLEGGDNAVRTRQVAGEDPGGEAELRIVGAADGLRLAVEGEHR